MQAATTAGHAVISKNKEAGRIPCDIAMPASAGLRIEPTLATDVAHPAPLLR